MPLELPLQNKNDEQHFSLDGPGATWMESAGTEVGSSVLERLLNTNAAYPLLVAVILQKLRTLGEEKANQSSTGLT